MAATVKIDYDTIVRAKEGDNEAINYIINAYMEDIRKCVWALTGKLSSQSKEDVVQETCIGIVKIIKSEDKFIL